MPSGVYWRPERMPRRPAIERFEEKAMPEPNSGCWIWCGHIDSLGYGRFRQDGRYTPMAKAHRAAWALYRGAIPSGMHVLHKCDVRCCVNPDHLFLGTHTDNMRDKIAKGRAGDTWSTRRRNMALEALS